MSLRITRVVPPKDAADDATAQFLRVRFRTLEMPPIRDGVIIGKSAPVSSDTMMETLKLVSTEKFFPVPVLDDTVGAIIVREGIIKRMQPALIAEFVVTRVKPFMSSSEVLRLDVEVDTLVEAAI